MINDLALKSPLKVNHWKYVDDITLSEAIHSDATTALQSDLDTISSWSNENNTNLNPKKCKEMIICPLKMLTDLAPLTINGVPLEKVSSHKILGLIIKDNIKWNDNIDDIVCKASKRLYIIRVLKRAGIPSQHLIYIYFALVRAGVLLRYMV